MSEILLSIITTFIGLFIGMWINNVFTWKIKNKIEALDKLYENLLIMEGVYLNVLGKSSLEGFRTQIHMADKLLDNRYDNQINDYVSFMEDEISSQEEEESIKHHKVKKYEIFFDDIIAYRKDLTSFCYMLKELNPFKNLCAK